MLVFFVALCLLPVFGGITEKTNNMGNTDPTKTWGKNNATEKTNNMNNTDSTKNLG
jgi:hypothetical protein